MSILCKKILNRESGLSLFGVSPPKLGLLAENVSEKAVRKANLINQSNFDGVVIYDIQDEGKRTQRERPFPYTPFMDSLDYAPVLGTELNLPQINYLTVSKYNKDSLSAILSDFNSNKGQTLFVFAGNTSSRLPSNLTLQQAYTIASSVENPAVIGAIAISERHLKQRNEAGAMIFKIKNGVKFFITQCIYNISIFEQLIKDYYTYCRESGLHPVTIFLTLSPILTPKALSFLEWLGIDVPDDFKKIIRSAMKNKENNKKDSKDLVLEYLETTAFQAIYILQKYGIPFGINIESVISRKKENCLAIELHKRIISKLSLKTEKMA